MKKRFLALTLILALALGHFSTLTAEEEQTSSEYVTVTINYLDADDGSALFGSYTARLIKDVDFTETVISPTWLGFTPVYHSLDRAAAYNAYSWTDTTITEIVAAQSISFSETVAEDLTINVYYIPAQVPYSVMYYMQNLNDDLYTENHDLYWTGTALTGTIIQDSVLTGAVEDQIQGFSMLYHYPTSVAADGSTCFECYLDRNYYLIQFDLDGGYGQDPIYARYEAPLNPATPTKAGYTFLGWEVYQDLNGNNVAEATEKLDGIPTTIPACNLIFKALWSKEANPDVTYIYWLQDAEGEGYSYWGSVIANTLTAGEVASGAEWNAETESAQVTINGNTYVVTDRSPEALYLLISDGTSESSFFENAEYTSYNEEKTEAEGGQVVLGNGSTTVNIYYDRNEYTLRFYFASQIGDTVSVSNLTKESLSKSFNSVSNITGTYDLSADGQGTEAKTRVVGNVTYYYFDLTVRFGADISKLWPATGYLGDGTVLDWRGETGGNNIQFLTWGSNEATQYYQTHDNKNIKGIYTILDASLIESTDVDSDDEDIDQDGVVESVTGFYAYHNTNPYKYVFAYQVQDSTTGEVTLLKVEPVRVTAVPSNMACSALSGYTYQTKSYQIYDASTGRWVASNGSATSAEGTYSATLSDGTEVEIEEVNCVITFTFTRNTYQLSFYSYGPFATIPFSYGQTIEEAFEALQSSSILRLESGQESSVEVYYTDIEDMNERFYPDGLEPNAYTFEGWYTNQLYTEDAKVDIATMTLPSQNTLLYAYWKPIVYTVSFYYNYEDLINDLIMTNEKGVPYTYSVNHGTSVGDSGCTLGDMEDQDVVDSNGNSITFYFNGWFYLENGMKTAVNLENTQIKTNMQIYADWTSEVPQPYRIQYKVFGEDTDVAEPLKGYGYQGTTRTFTAKVGDTSENTGDGQLYEAYNGAGWFSTVASHSMILRAEEDITSPEENVYTFQYIYLDEPITYTIRYVNKSDGTLLQEDKIVQTRYNVVTERFAAITGYVPDAFYKQLVLAVVWEDEDGDGIEDPNEWVSSPENIITFYYTPSSSTAFYAVHYMLQTIESAKNVDTPTYSITSSDFVEGSRVEAVADRGTYMVTPLSFAGFTRSDQPALWTNDSGMNVTSISEAGGTYSIRISDKGTELYIFYLRNAYSYRIELRKYYAEGTDDDLLGSILIGDDPEERIYFGETVSASHAMIEMLMEDEATKWENVPNLGIYVPVNGVEQEESITIRADDQKNPQNNVIVIYYTLRNYTIEYISGEGGFVSREQITITPESTDYSATATANPGYRFLGWYKDAEYSEAVDASMVTEEGTLTPHLSSLEASPSVNLFYARFEEIFGTLTITREEAEEDQTFIYQVQNQDDPSICLYVSVTGNESTTIRKLRQGTYTVTQVNDWSWRYTDMAVTVTLKEEGAVSFTQKRDRLWWLSDCAAIARLCDRRG